MTLCNSVGKWVNSGIQTREACWSVILVYPRSTGNLVGESVRFIGGRISYTWYPLLQNSLSTLKWYGRISETIHNLLKKIICNHINLHRIQNITSTASFDEQYRFY